MYQDDLRGHVVHLWEDRAGKKRGMVPYKTLFKITEAMPPPSAKLLFVWMMMMSFIGSCRNKK
jgi:hypothetical protein